MTSPDEPTNMCMRCTGIGCSNETRITRTSNIGEMATRSGYAPLFINGGGLAFACPTCAERLRAAYVILREVLGDKMDGVYLGNLARLTKTT